MAVRRSFDGLTPCMRSFCKSTRTERRARNSASSRRVQGGQSRASRTTCRPHSLTVSPAWAAQVADARGFVLRHTESEGVGQYFLAASDEHSFRKSFRINRFTAGIHETVSLVFLTSLPAYTRSGWPVVVTHGHAIACDPPGSDLPLFLCQLCAGFVHEVGAFSARIVRRSCTFCARIVFVSCTDLAQILHDCGTDAR